jgi:hypothetical protein
MYMVLHLHMLKRPNTGRNKSPPFIISHLSKKSDVNTTDVIATDETQVQKVMSRMELV